MTALAKRAVACKGWRWMPGMRYWVTTWDPDEFHRVTEDDRECLDAAPGLDDPATLGCLLALVREAWGDPSAVTSPDGVTWGVHVASAKPGQSVEGWDTMVSMEATEAEALVAALEAAP